VSIFVLSYNGRLIPLIALEGEFPMTKLSVFTPTHDPKYLLETFDSLLRQDYKNWEWVIVPNAKEGHGAVNIPDAIVSHPQVKIAPLYWKDKPLIGELKRYACDNCEGDVLVELDHDDMLVPDAMSRIARVFEETGAGFLYSDGASFSEHQEQILPQSYHGDYGWESYEFKVYGRTFLATRNFPVSPRSLCEVYYAPDHVRCWSRKAYIQVGGHDPTMEVCDDHELMVRCYLAGIKFQHLGGVCYLYRFHHKNTVKEAAQTIQTLTSRVRNKNMRKLIAEWCRREKLPVLKLESWAELPDPALRSLQARDENAEFGHIEIPFDLLPALDGWREIDFTFRKIYALLVPGGYLSATFPSATGASAFAPHYKSFWSAHTFEYFTHKALASKLPGGGPHVSGGLPFPRFQYVRYDEYCPSRGSAQLQKITAEVDLCALKSQRQPGRTFI